MEADSNADSMKVANYMEEKEDSGYEDKKAKNSLLPLLLPAVRKQVEGTADKEGHPELSVHTEDQQQHII